MHISKIKVIGAKIPMTKQPCPAQCKKTRHNKKHKNDFIFSVYNEIAKAFCVVYVELGMVKKIKSHSLFLLILLSALIVFIILRIPSFFEPHWYGDEGVYAGVVHAWEQGKTLYIDIWDNKPPGIYFLYALGSPENRLQVVKLLNFFAGLITLFGISAIARFMKFSLSGYTATLILVVTLLASPILEGTIANAENLFMPLIVWGIYFALQKSTKYSLVSGLLLGFAFWIKFHPAFDTAALFLALILVNRDRALYLAAGFAAAFALMVGYVATITDLYTGLYTIFFNNVGYTQTFSLGLLSQEVKLSILGISSAVAILGYKKKKTSWEMTLLLLLVAFEYYGSLFSGRSYKHYLLQVIPGISLLAGYLITQKRYALVVLFSILAIGGYGLFTVGSGPLVNTSPIRYYGDFFDYASGNKPYFLHEADIQIETVRTVLDNTYSGRRYHVYTDNPWFLDVLDVDTPVSFVAGYHQTLRPDGENIYARELHAFMPDVVVVDKDAFMTQSVQDILDVYYVIDYHDRYFSYYVIR